MRGPLCAARTTYPGPDPGTTARSASSALGLVDSAAVPPERAGVSVVEPKLVADDTPGVCPSDAAGSVAFTWGTTADERGMPFPCDRRVSAPEAAHFRGGGVQAPPAIVF